MTPRCTTNSERNQLIDDIFKAFSHRARPCNGFWATEEAEAVEKHLAGVGVSDLSFETVESCYGVRKSVHTVHGVVTLRTRPSRWPLGEQHFLVSMKPSMQLYFAPAFMALCIADYGRVPQSTNQILQWFREAGVGFRLFFSRRPSDFVDGLLRQIAEFPPLRGESEPSALRDVARWYFEALHPTSNPYVARLTDDERSVFRRFFRHLQATRPGEFALHGDCGRAVHAAGALLGDGQVSERLGATTSAECRHLMDVLDLLQAEFRAYFPTCKTKALREAMKSASTLD